MSWWDYGYQITAMANRTVLVDNNTWNNTHISRVGQVSGGTLQQNPTSEESHKWDSYCISTVCMNASIV